MKVIHTGLLFCMCLWHLLGGVKTDEVKSVSVMEGDSVTLNPDLQILREEETVWKFNSVRIARVKKDRPTYDNDERFKDRLKLDQTGSLTITNTRTTDSGLYELDTVIDNKESKKKFNVTVYAKPNITKTITVQNPSSSKHTSGAESTPASPSHLLSFSLIALVCAAAGALLGVGAVGAVGAFWISRKRRAIDQQAQTSNEEITYADPTFYRTQKAIVKQEDEVVYAGVVTRR